MLSGRSNNQICNKLKIEDNTFSLLIICQYNYMSIQNWASWWLKMVKHPPAMWETWVRSLGQEDHLEKEMATHSSLLAWKILRTEEPSGLQSMGSQGVRHD